MTIERIGPKRLVVGAHYGLKDWLAQRVTAVVMALFTLVLLVAYLITDEVTYEGWAGLFAMQWFKLLSLVTFLALYYHVWVGMRDIWMDYVKPVGIRLLLLVLTILWLAGSVVYFVHTLWRN